MNKHYDENDKELTQEDFEEIQALNRHIWECVEKGTMDFNCLKFIKWTFGFKSDELNN